MLPTHHAVQLNSGTVYIIYAACNSDNKCTHANVCEMIGAHWPQQKTWKEKQTEKKRKTPQHVPENFSFHLGFLSWYGDSNDGVIQGERDGEEDIGDGDGGDGINGDRCCIIFFRQVWLNSFTFHMHFKGTHFKTKTKQIKNCNNTKGNDEVQNCLKLTKENII